MPRKKAAIDPNEPMAILARVALEEQAEKAAERDNKKRLRAETLRQHVIQEEDAYQKRVRFQRVCDHLLGNHRVGVIPEKRRCALHKDTFSDKSVRIYCGKCRAEWKPGDTASILLRTEGYPPRPIRLPNPTGKGWKGINDFFYSFESAKDLTSIAFRVERVEPEYMPEDDEVPVPA
jgi:hypothetical protein